MQRNITQISLGLLTGLMALCLTACPKGTDDSGSTSTSPPVQSDPAINHETAANPCDDTAANPCNPCAADTNPCDDAAANPCGEGEAANPCGEASNPCGDAANPCNPCAEAKNPCAEAPVEVADASDVFQAGNCTLCHGPEMGGTALAPPLKNIASEWNSEELHKYIKDPQNYADSGQRLSHDPNYKTPMPPFVLPDADLDRLIAWLLTK